jgi:hypothetical protein
MILFEINQRQSLVVVQRRAGKPVEPLDGLGRHQGMVAEEHPIPIPLALKKAKRNQDPSQ